MKIADLRKAGHAPSLFSAFLHFDISFMVWVILGALMPFIAKDMHLSTAAKLTLAAAPALSAGFWRVLLGILVDRFGTKPVGTASMAITLVPLFLGWQFATSYTSLFYVALFLGIAGASFAVALPMASRWYPPELQGIALGIAGAGNSGTVIATLFAPMLAKTYGWHAVLGMLMVPVALVLVVFMLLAKEPQPNRKPAGLPEFVKVLGLADTWKFCLLYFVTFGGFVGMSLFFNTYFVDQYSIPMAKVGLYTAPFIIAGSFFRPVGGYLADRFGGVKMLSVLYTVCILCSTAMAVVISSFGVSILILFVLMSCLGMGNGSVFQMVPQRFGKEIGIMTGIVGAAGGEGGFYLNLTMGYLHKIFNSYAAGFLAFSLIAVFALITLLVSSKAWKTSWLGEQRSVTITPEYAVVAPTQKEQSPA